MATRRTKQQIQAERLNAWATNRLNNYAGHFSCSKCGRLTYCTGRTRDSVKCRTCFGLT